MTGKTRAGGLPPFDGVLLDMDGLLVDSEVTYMHAWRHAALSFGVELGDGFLDSLSGLHAAQVEACLIELMGDRFEREAFHRRAGQIWREYVAARGIRPMPGADRLLAWLAEAEMPHALATNSDAAATRRCLEHAGLAGRFPVMVCRDEVAAGKPEPDLYVEAAARLGLGAARCLVLEDSHVGLLAAARAGAMPVLVSTRPVTEDTRGLAKAVFASLDEVVLSLRADTLDSA